MQYVTFCVRRHVFMFIHIVAGVSPSFLSMATWYSITRLCHVLFIHSAFDGHVSRFYFLAIVNSGIESF